MKTLFKKRFRREGGFTLTELAVAMLVVGILSAIAVPSFLGARNSAFDKEAQSAVDAAMAAAKIHYAQYGDFSDADSDTCFQMSSTLQNDLQKIEPNLDFIHALQGSTGPRTVSVTGWVSYNSAFEELGCQVFYAAALSRSGSCWVGRITVEGKYLWPGPLEYGGTTYAPIIVQGDKNTENEEQVSMTDAALNGNAYAAFKPQSPTADQTADERETLTLSQSLCTGFDSVEGIFPYDMDGVGLIRTFEYYDSWRNVVRSTPTTETSTTSTTSTTVYTEP
jgi:prepilin-type N-terminal cleavage/methylation domain-containing protein